MGKKKTCFFNEKDYNSGDGMLTSVWGPALWHSLHTMSFNYPVKPSKEQKQYYKDFFMNLQKVLPCRYCRENYKKNLKAVPLTKTVLKNRENFSRWVYDLHNHINGMLGKKSKLSYEDVRDRYEHFRARCLVRKEVPAAKCSIKEKGCTEPLYGVKSKCVVNIVPKTSRKSFKMDPRCKLKKERLNYSYNYLIYHI